MFFWMVISSTTYSMPSPPAASSSSSNILLRNQKVFFLGRLVRFSRCFISRRYKSIVGQANESENAQDNAEKRLICWCPGVKIISRVYWVDRRSLSCSAVDQRSSVKSEPIRAASSHHAVLMRVRVIVLVTLLCNGVLHNPIQSSPLRDRLCLALLLPSCLHNSASPAPFVSSSSLHSSASSAPFVARGLCLHTGNQLNMSKSLFFLCSSKV
jgi:hypothetical protein